MDMNITHVTKAPDGADWGKVKCYFSIEIGNGIIIPSFKLIDGANGLFVAPPSIKSDDGYKDLVYLRKEARDEILPLAIAAFKETPDTAGSQQPLISPDMPQGGASSNTTDLPF